LRRDGVLDREVPGLGQGGIVDRSGVPLRKNELVAVLPVGLVGAVSHNLEEQRGDDVRVGERTARMTGLGGKRHFYDMSPEQVGLGLQHLYGLVIVQSQIWHLGERRWSIIGQLNKLLFFPRAEARPIVPR
jgi:hypothetical protein